MVLFGFGEVEVRVGGVLNAISAWAGWCSSSPCALTVLLCDRLSVCRYSSGLALALLVCRCSRCIPSPFILEQELR